jgi:protein arginine phosphatase
MAAAMARQRVGAMLHAESAGISATVGTVATREAVLAMQERGVDISRHRSRALSGLDLSDFDLVVALTPAIARHLRAVGTEPSRIATLDVPDPLGKGLDAYRATAGVLESALERLLPPGPERPSA